MKDNIIGKAWGWVSGRVLEPSSWAAAAAVLIGVSVILTITWMMWAGIIAAVGALVIKERGGWDER
jgi:hypothetical protein|tara:strand:+ start:1070 stop:1267 length:198 start_codon:yes stop_codon:yes gene_type:complete